MASGTINNHISFESFQTISAASFTSNGGSGTLSCEVYIVRYLNMYKIHGYISSANYTKGSSAPSAYINTNLRPSNDITIFRSILVGNTTSSSTFAFNELGYMLINTNGQIIFTKNWHMIAHNSGCLQFFVPGVIFTL